MRAGLLVLALVSFVLVSKSAQALPGQNNCAKWSTNVLFTDAIKAVAVHTNYAFDELCNLPRIWDIEAQPTRVILRDGEVIPHVAIQLHYETYSCLYKVRDTDKVITSSSCYSGE